MITDLERAVSSGVHYEARHPAPPLGDYVDRLWIVQGPSRVARERVLPTATVELLFNLHDDLGRIWDPSGRERRGRGAGVAGCYDSTFEFETRATTDVVGVHFKPGGAARLLEAPPGAFPNLHVSFGDVWGAGASELHERLAGCRTSREKFDLLERVLLARLSSCAPRRPTVVAALAALDAPGIEVGSVARMLGLSRRRLIEVFSEDVGVTPKRYSMIRRFQRALALAKHTPPSWSRIAAEAGYYDQAHLCRDWSELTRLSPQEFVAQRGLVVKDNHVAVPERGSNPSKPRGVRAG